MKGEMSKAKGGSKSPGRTLGKAGAEKLSRPDKSNRGGISSTEKRINNRNPQYRKGGE
jgi:hypothetical protein